MSVKEAKIHTELVELLEQDDDAKLASWLADARAADIAESFRLLPDKDRSRIIFALPPHTAAEVVVLLDEAVREEVVEELDTASLREIVAELPLDDAADVLGELEPREIGEIFKGLEAEKVGQLAELLEYDESTAGGIMTPEVVAVPAAATVADAIEYIREASPNEDLHEVYIVDEERKLLGTVPLRKLVTHPRHTRLRDICDDKPVTVYATDPQETVLQIFRKYDVVSVAVVHPDGTMLGQITHDDLLDVADEEAEEDLFRMAGTDAAELESRSVLKAARIRLTWLLPCMAGMMLSAGVLRIAEPSFPLIWGALILFVPMLGAVGGNTGIQTSTVIVRGFASGELASTSLVRALLREGRISLVMAPACGVTAWALVRFALPVFDTLFGIQTTAEASPERVAFAVGIAMTLAVVVSATLGIALPFIFRAIRVDPAIASGPIVTTANDVLSVSAYMITAYMIVR